MSGIAGLRELKDSGEQSVCFSSVPERNRGASRGSHPDDQEHGKNGGCTDSDWLEEIDEKGAQIHLRIVQPSVGQGEITNRLVLACGLAVLGVADRGPRATDVTNISARPPEDGSGNSRLIHIKRWQPSACIITAKTYEAGVQAFLVIAATLVGDCVFLE